MKLAVFLDAVWAPLVVTQLGWVDSDLWSSSGWLAASADTYFPTGGWNIPNLSQPNPGAQPPWSSCTVRGQNHAYQIGRGKRQLTHLTLTLKNLTFDNEYKCSLVRTCHCEDNQWDQLGVQQPCAEGT